MEQAKKRKTSPTQKEIAFLKKKSPAPLPALAGIVAKQSIYCGWGGWQKRQPAAQKGSFSPKAPPIRDKLSKKCTSSPKPTPFRDKLSKKCISSPKATSFREKPSLPTKRNALSPQKHPHSGTNPPRNAFPPRKQPHSGRNHPCPPKEMHFLPKSNPVPGEVSYKKEMAGKNLRPSQKQLWY